MTRTHSQTTLRDRFARRWLALAALGAALVVGACQPQGPGAAQPDEALARLTAVAGGAAGDEALDASDAAAEDAQAAAGDGEAADAEGAADHDAAGAMGQSDAEDAAGAATPAASSSNEALLREIGIEEEDLPGLGQEESLNAPAAGGIQESQDAFKATQTAQEAEAGIANVDGLVMSMPPLATFTPSPRDEDLEGSLLYVRSGRFYTANADGTEIEPLPLEDGTMPNLWAPPEDPGRAWLSPDGERVAFFTGTDAEVWTMDVDGRNNQQVFGSALPDEQHLVAANGEEKEIKIRPGGDYTLVYRPGGPDPFGVLVDVNDYARRGEGRVRVVHAVRGMPDTIMQASINGEPAGGRIRYGRSGEPELVTSGQVSVYVSDDQGADLASVPAFVLEDQELRTVFLHGEDEIQAASYNYPAGSRPASGAARVRVFNAGAEPIDVTVDGQASPVRQLPSGELSEYFDVQGTLSRDARQDMEISIYGLRPGENPVAWSPDSERLAFLSGLSGVIDLFLHEDGEQPRQLTSDTLREVDPRWSPDSEKLVWVSIDEGYGSNQIFVWDGGNAAPRPINVEPVRQAGQVPVGTSVVYPGGIDWIDDERVFFTPSAARESLGIWAYDLERDALEQIYAGKVDRPEWSLEAQRWVFTADEDGRIVTLTPEGEEQVVVPSGGFAPQWAPDAERITYGEGVSTDSSGWRLRIVGADGDDDTALTEKLPLMQESPPVPGPNVKRFWLDDGGLLFTRVGRDYGRREREGIFGRQEAGDDIENLWGVEADGGGGGVAQITDLAKGFYINDVTLSPDGDEMAFVAFSYLNRAQQLYAVAREGGKPVLIDGAVRWFTWRD